MTPEEQAAKEQRLESYNVLYDLYLADNPTIDADNLETIDDPELLNKLTNAQAKANVLLDLERSLVLDEDAFEEFRNEEKKRIEYVLDADTKFNEVHRELEKSSEPPVWSPDVSRSYTKFRSGKRRPTIADLDKEIDKLTSAVFNSSRKSKAAELRNKGQVEGVTADAEKYAEDQRLKYIKNLKGGGIDVRLGLLQVGKAQSSGETDESFFSPAQMVLADIPVDEKDPGSMPVEAAVALSDRKIMEEFKNKNPGASEQDVRLNLAFEKARKEDSGVVEDVRQMLLEKVSTVTEIDEKVSPAFEYLDAEREVVLKDIGEADQKLRQLLAGQLGVTIEAIPQVEPNKPFDIEERGTLNRGEAIYFSQLNADENAGVKSYLLTSEMSPVLRRNQLQKRLAALDSAKLDIGSDPLAATSSPKSSNNYARDIGNTNPDSYNYYREAIGKIVSPALMERTRPEGEIERKSIAIAATAVDEQSNRIDILKKSKQTEAVKEQIQEAEQEQQVLKNILEATRIEEGKFFRTGNIAGDVLVEPAKSVVSGGVSLGLEIISFFSSTSSDRIDKESADIARSIENEFRGNQEDIFDRINSAASKRRETLGVKETNETVLIDEFGQETYDLLTSNGQYSGDQLVSAAQKYNQVSSIMKSKPVMTNIFEQRLDYLMRAKNFKTDRGMFATEITFEDLPDQIQQQSFDTKKDLSGLTLREIETKYPGVIDYDNLNRLSKIYFRASNLYQGEEIAAGVMRPIMTEETISKTPTGAYTIHNTESTFAHIMNALDFTGQIISASESGGKIAAAAAGAKVGSIFGGIPGAVIGAGVGALTTEVGMTIGYDLDDLKAESELIEVQKSRLYNKYGIRSRDTYQILSNLLGNIDEFKKFVVEKNTQDNKPNRLEYAASERVLDEMYDEYLKVTLSDNDYRIVNNMSGLTASRFFGNDIKSVLLGQSQVRIHLDTPMATYKKNLKWRAEQGIDNADTITVDMIDDLSALEMANAARKIGQPLDFGVVAETMGRNLGLPYQTTKTTADTYFAMQMLLPEPVDFVLPGASKGIRATSRFIKPTRGMTRVQAAYSVFDPTAMGRKLEKVAKNRTPSTLQDEILQSGDAPNVPRQKRMFENEEAYQLALQDAVKDDPGFKKRDIIKLAATTGVTAGLGYVFSGFEEEGALVFGARNLGGYFSNLAKYRVFNGLNTEILTQTRRINSEIDVIENQQFVLNQQRKTGAISQQELEAGTQENRSKVQQLMEQREAIGSEASFNEKVGSYVRSNMEASLLKKYYYGGYMMPGIAQARQSFINMNNQLQEGENPFRSFAATRNKNSSAFQDDMMSQEEFAQVQTALASVGLDYDTLIRQADYEAMGTNQNKIQYVLDLLAKPEKTQERSFLNDFYFNKGADGHEDFKKIRETLDNQVVSGRLSADGKHLIETSLIMTALHSGRGVDAFKGVSLNFERMDLPSLVKAYADNKYPARMPTVQLMNEQLKAPQKDKPKKPVSLDKKIGELLNSPAFIDHREFQNNAKINGSKFAAEEFESQRLDGAPAITNDGIYDFMNDHNEKVQDLFGKAKLTLPEEEIDVVSQSANISIGDRNHTVTFDIKEGKLILQTDEPNVSVAEAAAVVRKFNEGKEYKRVKSIVGIGGFSETIVSNYLKNLQDLINKNFIRDSLFITIEKKLINERVTFVDAKGGPLRDPPEFDTEAKGSDPDMFESIDVDIDENKSTRNIGKSVQSPYKPSDDVDVFNGFGASELLLVDGEKNAFVRRAKIGSDPVHIVETIGSFGSEASDNSIMGLFRQLASGDIKKSELQKRIEDAQRTELANISTPDMFTKYNTIVRTILENTETNVYAVPKVHPSLYSLLTGALDFIGRSYSVREITDPKTKQPYLLIDVRLEGSESLSKIDGAQIDPGTAALGIRTDFLGPSETVAKWTGGNEDVAVNLQVDILSSLANASVDVLEDALTRTDDPRMRETLDLSIRAQKTKKKQKYDKVTILNVNGSRIAVISQGNRIQLMPQRADKTTTDIEDLNLIYMAAQEGFTEVFLKGAGGEIRKFAERWNLPEPKFRNGNYTLKLSQDVLDSVPRPTVNLFRSGKVDADVESVSRSYASTVAITDDVSVEISDDMFKILIQPTANNSLQDNSVGRVIESLGALWTRLISPELKQKLLKEFESTVDGELTPRGYRDLAEVYSLHLDNGFAHVDADQYRMMVGLHDELATADAVAMQTGAFTGFRRLLGDNFTSETLVDIAARDPQKMAQRSQEAQELFGPGGVVTGAEGYIRAGSKQGMTPAQSIRTALVYTKDTDPRSKGTGSNERNAMRKISRVPNGQNLIEYKPSNVMLDFNDPARLIPEKNRARRDKAIRYLTAKGQQIDPAMITDAEVRQRYQALSGESIDDINLTAYDIDTAYLNLIVDGKRPDEVSLGMRIIAKIEQEKVIAGLSTAPEMVQLTNRSVFPKQDVSRVNALAQRVLEEMLGKKEADIKFEHQMDRVPSRLTPDSLFEVGLFYTVLHGNAGRLAKMNLRSHLNVLQGTRGASSLSENLKNRILNTDDDRLILFDRDIEQIRDTIIDVHASNRNFRSNRLENAAAKASIGKLLYSMSKMLPEGKLQSTAESLSIGVDTAIKAMFTEEAPLSTLNPVVTDFKRNLMRSLSIETKQEVINLIRKLKMLEYAKVSGSVNPAEARLSQRDIQMSMNSLLNENKTLFSSYFGTNKPVNEIHLHHHRELMRQFGEAEGETVPLDKSQKLEMLDTMEKIYAESMTKSFDDDIKAARHAIENDDFELTDRYLSVLAVQIKTVDKKILHTNDQILSALGIDTSNSYFESHPYEGYRLFYMGKFSDSEDNLFRRSNIQKEINKINTREEFEGFVVAANIRKTSERDAKQQTIVTVRDLDNKAAKDGYVFTAAKETPEYFRELAAYAAFRYSGRVSSLYELKNRTAKGSAEQDPFQAEAFVVEFMIRSINESKIQQGIKELADILGFGYIEDRLMDHLRSDSKLEYRFNTDLRKSYQDLVVKLVGDLTSGKPPTENAKKGKIVKLIGELESSSKAAEQFYESAYESATDIYKGLSLERTPIRGEKKIVEVSFGGDKSILLPEDLFDNIQETLDSVAPIGVALTKDIPLLERLEYHKQQDMYYRDALRSDLVEAIARRYKDEFGINENDARRLAEYDELYVEMEQILGDSASPNYLKQEVEKLRTYIGELNDIVELIPQQADRRKVLDEVFDTELHNVTEKVFSDETKAKIRNTKKTLSALDAVITTALIPSVPMSALGLLFAMTAKSVGFGVLGNLLTAKKSVKDFGVSLEESVLATRNTSMFKGPSALSTSSEFALRGREFLAEGLNRKAVTNQKRLDDAKTELQNMTSEIETSYPTDANSSVSLFFKELLLFSRLKAEEQAKNTKKAALRKAEAIGQLRGGDIKGLGELANIIITPFEFVNRIFKQVLTTGVVGYVNTGYFVNNTIGALYQLYLQEGNTGFSKTLGIGLSRPNLVNRIVSEMLEQRDVTISLNNSMAEEFLSGKHSDRVFTSSANGKTYTVSQIVSALQREQIGSSFIGVELASNILTDLELEKNMSTMRLFSQFGFTNTMQAVRDFSERLDMNFRVMHFIKLLDDGHTFKQAAKIARETFYDYGDLTAFEKKYLRNLFTFYAFMKKNQAHHVRTLTQRPGNIVKTYRFIQQSQREVLGEDDERYNHRLQIGMPSYLEDRVFLYGKDFDFGSALTNNKISGGLKGQATLGPNLGLIDGLKMVTMGLSPMAKATQGKRGFFDQTTQYLFGQITPILGLPSLLEVDPFGMRPLEDSQMTEADFERLTEYASEFLGKRLVAKTTDPDEVKSQAFFLVEEVESSEAVPTIRGPRMYRMAQEVPSGELLGKEAAIRNGSKLYFLRQVTAFDPALQRSQKSQRAMQSALVRIANWSGSFVDAPKLDDELEGVSWHQLVEGMLGLGVTNIKSERLQQQDIMSKIYQESKDEK